MPQQVLQKIRGGITENFETSLRKEDAFFQKKCGNRGPSTTLISTFYYVTQLFWEKPV